MEKIIIEKMNLKDFEQIKENLQKDFDDFWNANILESELKNDNSLYFVAKKEEKILGFIGIIKNIDFIEISNIVVKKDFRNKGIGNKLLQKIIEVAKQMKKNEIYLEVNEKNDNAIFLYEKNNFQKVGIRKKYYNGKDNAILMSLKIL